MVARELVRAEAAAIMRYARVAEIKRKALALVPIADDPRELNFPRRENLISRPKRPRVIFVLPQNARLRRLAAIVASKSCLRRDTCGDWACFGRNGHVFAVPEGFQFFVSTGGRPKKWTWVKRRISGHHRALYCAPHCGHSGIFGLSLEKKNSVSHLGQKTDSKSSKQASQ